MPVAPSVTRDDIISRFILLCLFQWSEWFSGVIEGNRMKILQYDVINSTSIWRKYEEKMYSISVSLINFFITIFYYN